MTFQRHTEHDMTDGNPDYRISSVQEC